MSLLTIDPQKCRHDGICAAVCPAGIIAAPTQQQLPFVVAHPRFRYHRLPLRNPPAISWQ